MTSYPSGDPEASNLIDAADPRALLDEARRLFAARHPAGPFALVERAFGHARELYAGVYPGYRACAVEYHDYGHTLSVFAASSRLLDGCSIAGTIVPADTAAELLAAALLHDAGYIQERGDEEGTGAKYTRVHVGRSADFVRREATAFGLDGGRAERVARMILGTDLARSWKEVEFDDEEERMAGEILAAADILGQMADRDYLEKLLFLYYEFREAGIAGYDTAYDILTKTAGFYAMIEKRLDEDLGRVSRRSREHFALRRGIDRDLYREGIDRNMTYLSRILADDSTNFRAKLKRIDWEAIERPRGGA